MEQDRLLFNLKGLPATKQKFMSTKENSHAPFSGQYSSINKRKSKKLAYLEIQSFNETKSQHIGTTGPTQQWSFLTSVFNIQKKCNIQQPSKQPLSTFSFFLISTLLLKLLLCLLKGSAPAAQKEGIHACHSRHILVSTIYKYPIVISNDTFTFGTCYCTCSIHF